MRSSLVRLRRLFFYAALSVLAAVAIPAVATAQPGPYRMKQLAPGVHVMERDDSPGGASDSNVLIIVNESDVIVVDANIFPASARQTVAEVRKLTRLPVRYVVTTHWHSDHHYGNQVIREAYPGVEFVGHPFTRHMVITDDIPSLAQNLGTEYPAEVARYRKAVETGKRSNGEPVTPEMRKQLVDQIAMYEFFMADMKSTKLIPPTLTVADSLVFIGASARSS